MNNLRLKITKEFVELTQNDQKIKCSLDLFQDVVRQFQNVENRFIKNPKPCRSCGPTNWKPIKPSIEDLT